MASGGAEETLKNLVDKATYERDTSALLDTREAEVRACFEAELERNRDLLGTLTLSFTVEQRTGSIVQLQWDNDVLATCVVTALDGLALAEPDRRDGVATFSYSFRGQDGP